MPVEANGVALLREKVLQSLQRKQKHSSANANEVDLEDGEILEEGNAIDPAIPVTTPLEHVVSPTLPGSRPDPSQARQIVSYLHSKGFTFQDLLSQGLSQEFLSKTYAELHLPSPSYLGGSEQNLLGHSSRTEPVLATISSQHSQGKATVDKNRPVTKTISTSPWLANVSLSEDARKRLAPSEAGQTSNRPYKRFGVERHPSLVIDLESDVTEEESLVTSPTSSQEPTAEHTASTASRDQPTRVDQLESEIASAMSIINKVQDLQNAKRGADSNLGSNANLLHKAVSPTPHSDIESKEVQTNDYIRLNKLQHELIENDNVKAANQNALELLKTEALLVHAKLLELEKERLSVDLAIKAGKEEVERLQFALAALHGTSEQLRLELLALDSTVRDSASSQVDLLSAIAGCEERREVLRPQIRHLQAVLASHAEKHSGNDLKRNRVSQKASISDTTKVISIFNPYKRVQRTGMATDDDLQLDPASSHLLIPSSLTPTERTTPSQSYVLAELTTRKDDESISKSAVPGIELARYRSSKYQTESPDRTSKRKVMLTAKSSTIETYKSRFLGVSPQPSIDTPRL